MVEQAGHVPRAAAPGQLPHRQLDWVQGWVQEQVQEQVQERV